jgi:hypothetical protein
MFQGFVLQRIWGEPFEAPARSMDLGTLLRGLNLRRARDEDTRSFTLNRCARSIKVGVRQRTPSVRRGVTHQDAGARGRPRRKSNDHASTPCSYGEER